MKTVEEYIASFEGNIRERLAALDGYIKSLNGKITTKISWVMPSYMLDNDYVVQICAFKNHIGLYPGTVAIDVFRQNFAKEELKHTKGGVQLPNDRPLPFDLIRLIVLYNCEQRISNQIRNEGVPRSQKPLSDCLKARLIQEGQLENYNTRPRYQRTDYISWIEKAVRTETREKRISQMIEELRNGDAYMGMVYNAKRDE